MKRGPKPGKTRPAPRPIQEDLGAPPESLGPRGRELWVDAVAHLRASGKASRVYRHPLIVVCQLLDSVGQDGEMGLNRIDSFRRWLHELGLTPAAQTGIEWTTTHGTPTTGKARILDLIARRGQSA
jgi:hypothetical protein